MKPTGARILVTVDSFYCEESNQFEQKEHNRPEPKAHGHYKSYTLNIWNYFQFVSRLWHSYEYLASKASSHEWRAGHGRLSR